MTAHSKSTLAALAYGYARKVKRVRLMLGVAPLLWATATGCGRPQLLAASDASEVAGNLVQQAALPYWAIYHGKSLKNETLNQLLGSRQVVCVGERHDDPAHHYAQWQVTLRAGAAAAAANEPFALGLEMLSTDHGQALSRFAAGQISQNDFLLESHWKKNWGFPFAYYQPTLNAAKHYGGLWVALNVPRDAVKRIAREGYHAGRTANLPRLDLDQEQHRDFFSRALGIPLKSPRPLTPITPHPSPHASHSPRPSGSHSHGTMTAENIYAAQVLWDTGMAARGHLWLNRHSTRRPHLVILAGNGHCHESGIPLRLRALGSHSTLSVRPVRFSRLGKSQAPRDDEFDLLIVLDDRKESSPTALH